MHTTTYAPGKLVRFRDRTWIILPSGDEELVRMKPLGGSDHEITGVYLPLKLNGEEIEEDTFPRPSVHDLGAFETAKMLFDASRLSFRNASGPFRCMGKLSFRPRAYQIVPLVMALKQETTRLLVADDVGIGKTIEALLIIRELLERGEVKNFAVITPPHLCEQWQNELHDKLDIRAEIIRSSTAARLDRHLPDDRSIFYHLPYQVISIDYIKAEKRKPLFLNDAPDLIIVDEAHTCALPAGSKSKAQQQRYALLNDLADEESKHLVLLTATPHSGKDEEFLSLLGLLNKEFANYHFEEIGQKHREKIAHHFIQRKRENIKHWLEEETPFPDRDPREEKFYLSPEYHLFYEDVLRFARGISTGSKNRQTERIRYWAALALLRGVMSSPAAGLSMLQNRQSKKMEEELQQVMEREVLENPVLDKLSQDSDFTRPELLDSVGLIREEINEISELAEAINGLFGFEKDTKARKAAEIVKNWIKEDFQPIVFCKYIETAKYVGGLLKQALPSSVDVRVVTSEMADEQRKEQIESMGNSNKRVLVATDCLSEGINLQEYFTAVLHYDLPWNPNRIAQREGRIDRFGQTAPLVKAWLLLGEDNPIDKVVMKVLIKKVWDIQNATGVNISLGDDDQSIMDKVLRDVLLGSSEEGQQMELFADQFYSAELEKARLKAENLRSIFAHSSINPEYIKKDLHEVDEAIGDVKTVEMFVLQAVKHLGATVVKDANGYILYPRNLPAHLKNHFDGNDKVFISFESPTPKGYRYIGRNHLFTEQLCQFVLSLAFDESGDYHRVARAAEIVTDKVQLKTTLVMFRVRNVIKEVRSSHEVVSEEMYLWGYRGSGPDAGTIEYGEAKKLLQEAVSKRDLSIERQRSNFENELHQFDRMENRFLELATQRAENLVKAHGRFKELVGGRRYEKATPVLPPDVMGVYILVPQPKLAL
jgi:superfamily II DNA or RNA helicase